MYINFRKLILYSFFLGLMYFYTLLILVFDPPPFISGKYYIFFGLNSCRLGDGLGDGMPYKSVSNLIITGLLVDMAEEVSVFLLSNPLFYLYFTKNLSPSPQSGPQKYYGTFIVCK